ncbi:MAG TPA: nitroreductase family protein [Candidatus Polarisedimenticolia bacterium]|jgi:nitroreductase
MSELGKLRTAPVSRPINALIAGRWSSRSFSDARIEIEKIASVFEAARWAPSCFNEQPWRYVFATREDPEAFGRLASWLVEGNAWARSAWLLALSVAKLAFERNGKPNPHAWHDVGAASENMFLQAAELGLHMHEMAGFDRQRARESLGLDANHDPVAMIAIGYPGDPAAMPEALRLREEAPRARIPVESFAFRGGWGNPARL